MTEKLTCQSCDETKMNLERVNSKLVPGWKLNLCTTCIKNKYEPRYLIILAVRQFGLNARIEEYILKQRYVGDPIPADNILPLTGKSI